MFVKRKEAGLVGIFACLVVIFNSALATDQQDGKRSDFAQDSETVSTSLSFYLQALAKRNGATLLQQLLSDSLSHNEIGDEDGKKARDGSDLVAKSVVSRMSRRLGIKLDSFYSHLDVLDEAFKSEIEQQPYFKSQDIPSPCCPVHSISTATDSGDGGESVDSPTSSSCTVIFVEPDNTTTAGEQAGFVGNYFETKTPPRGTKRQVRTTSSCCFLAIEALNENLVFAIFSSICRIMGVPT